MNKKTLNTIPRIKKSHGIFLSAVALAFGSIMLTPLEAATQIPSNAKSNGAGGYTGGIYIISSSIAAGIGPAGGFVPRVDTALEGSTAVLNSMNVFGGSNSLDRLRIIVNSGITINQGSYSYAMGEDASDNIVLKDTYSIGVLTNGSSVIDNYGIIKNTNSAFSSTSDRDATKNTTIGVQLVSGDVLNVRSGGQVQAERTSGATGTNVTGTSTTLATDINATDKNGVAVYGVNTDAGGGYTINVENGGTIYAKSAGTAATYGIDAGGGTSYMTVNNSGTVYSYRTGITIASSVGNTRFGTWGYNSVTGTGAGNSSGTSKLNSLGVNSAIYVQEEPNNFTLVNSSTGNIYSRGTALTSTLYLRSWEQDITNAGTISAYLDNGTTIGGLAIGSQSDALRKSTFELENSGTINGDVASVGGASTRFYQIMNLKSQTGGTTFTNYNGGSGTSLFDALALTRAINSGAGVVDATIVNTGDINGKIWLGNGTHNIVNDGTITGAILVDQADARCGGLSYTADALAGAAAGLATTSSCGIKAGSVNHNNTIYGGDGYQALADNIAYVTAGSGNATASTITDSATGIAAGKQFLIHGTKEFTMSGSGTLTGDLAIITQQPGSGTYTNAMGLTTNNESSEIHLSPTFTSQGVATSTLAEDTTARFVRGTLSIQDYVAGQDSADATTTVSPTVSGITITGTKWYKIAAAYRNDDDDLPEVGNRALLDFSLIKGTDNSLLVSATAKSGSTITGLSSSGLSTLNNILSYSNSLGGSLQSMETAEEVRSAVEKLRPEANNGAHQAAVTVTDKVFGLVESRLNEVHLAGISKRTGIATGNQPDGVGFWMQGFGGKGDQDKRGAVDGYKTDAFGFAIGADQLLGRGVRVGLAGSYGQSRYNSTGGLVSRTNIDTYQGTLYASKLMNNWYMNATLGLGYHDYKSNRVALTDYVKGNHDAWQYTAKLDAGYPFQFNAFTIAPVASIGYSRLNENGYTESGTGALAIGSRGSDSLRSGLGAKAMIPVLEGDVNAGIELRALWSHEFMNTNQDTTARFVDGGGTFTSSGINQRRDGADLGASIRLAGVMDGIQHTLMINYDAQIKPQYLNQTASLHARFDF